MSTVSYVKIIPIKYDIVNYPADTSHTLVRTYTNYIPNADSISVSFNGQKIPLRTSETISTFSKYYFEITSLTSSLVTITIKANSIYINPGYNTSTPAETGFTTQDTLYLEYSYQTTA